MNMTNAQGYTADTDAIDSLYRSEFIASFIMGALGGTTDMDTEDDPLDKKYGPEDIHPDAMAKIEAMCNKFMDENAVWLALAMQANEYDHEWPDLPGYRDTTGDQAGYDFFMTLARHGVGFWEDDDWPTIPGHWLTEASHRYHMDMYAGDDGKIYI